MVKREPRPLQSPPSAPRPASTRLVWVTRAEPGAAATAGRLVARGWTSLVAPLIATRDLPWDRAAVEAADALAFTSAAGVRAFRSAGRETLPVFTVGDATADAAKAAGFADVRSAKGAGADLASLIQAAPPVGRVIHLGAKEPAFDLVAALTGAGVAAVHVPTYETVGLAASAAALAALKKGQIAAVLIHSPAAARALADAGVAAGLQAVDLVALSQACAAPVAALPFRERRIAAEPTEAALLHALGNPGGESYTPPLTPQGPL